MTDDTNPRDKRGGQHQSGRATQQSVARRTILKAGVLGFGSTALGVRTGQARTSRSTSDPAKSAVSSIEEPAGWEQIGELNTNDLTGNDQLTSTVEVDCTTVVVGAYEMDSEAGALYVFEYDDGDWNQTKVIAADADPDEQLGYSIAVDGDTIVSSTSTNDPSRTGTVYVFQRAGDEWEQTRLAIENDNSWNSFGISVAMDDDRIVVGNPGSAYIFERVCDGWERTKLVPSDSNWSRSYGRAVDIDSDRIVVSDQD
ncbi:hypothetical protein [Haladaptatus sp. NG-SE-30]